MQMNRSKAVALIVVAAFVCYFVSEAVLRQFVLHRSGAQTISLDENLALLPVGIRDFVRKKVTIAELKDKLKVAKTDKDIIYLSIALGRERGEAELQEAYAMVLKNYPKAPEATSAYLNFLLAPKTALKSISIKQFHQYLKLLPEEEQCYFWQAGLARMNMLKTTDKQKIDFLLPLLKIKPKFREYQELYIKLWDLADKEKMRDVEIKARKLDEYCKNKELPYCDEALERRARALKRRAERLAKKKAAAEAKRKAQAKAKADVNKAETTKKTVTTSGTGKK